MVSDIIRWYWRWGRLGGMLPVGMSKNMENVKSSGSRIIVSTSENFGAESKQQCEIYNVIFRGAHNVALIRNTTPAFV